MKGIKMQDLKMMDTKIGHETIARLICMYRMLVRNAVFGAVYFIGFVHRCLMFFFCLV